MKTTLMRLPTRLLVTLICLLPFQSERAVCQEDDAPKIVIPVIADEPGAVDPATLVPESLAQNLTVEFTEASLSEVGNWIQQNAGIPVLFDQAAIAHPDKSRTVPVRGIRLS